MAITIDHSTYVISIPKADTLLIQSTPIEVRQLNIGDFHEILRDLEDDPDGIVLPTTHSYVAPISVGGADLAKVMSILDPYTVTFEDGQYAVNIVGGNSNIADKVNINNVGIRTANSAGLPDLEAIQVASFNGRVTVENGSPYSGTTYPVGTASYPVNNIPDARLIAQKRSLKSMHINGNFTFSTGDDISGFKVFADNALTSTLTINSGALTENTHIVDATVTGNLDGGALLERCVVSNINHVNGFVYLCMLAPGTINLTGSSTAFFLSCYSGSPDFGYPVIDMNGVSNTANTALAMQDFKGSIRLREKTGNSSGIINLSGGIIEIEDSCTGGILHLTGQADARTPLGGHITTGVINGGLQIYDHTISGNHIHEMWRDMGLDEDFPVSISDDGTTTTHTVASVVKLITDTSITRQ